MQTFIYIYIRCSIILSNRDHCLFSRLTDQGSRIVFIKFKKEVGDDASKMDWNLQYRLSVCAAELTIASSGNTHDMGIVFDLEHFSMGLNNSYVANLILFKRFIETVQVRL